MFLIDEIVVKLLTANHILNLNVQHNYVGILTYNTFAGKHYYRKGN